MRLVLHSQDGAIHVPLLGSAFLSVHRHQKHREMRRNPQHLFVNFSTSPMTVLTDVTQREPHRIISQPLTSVQ